MKRVLTTLTTLAIALAAACGTTPEDDGSPSASKLKHYRAWCKTEQKYLGEWDPDRSKAEALRAAHNKRWPHDIVLIQTVER